VKGEIQLIIDSETTMVRIMLQYEYFICTPVKFSRTLTIVFLCAFCHFGAWQLHADTPDEAQKWVDALQDHLPKEAQAANAANAAADLLADSPGGMFAATGQTGTLRDGAERPIRVTVTKGQGLKSVRANGSNAMVFVTAVVPAAKSKPESRHQFQISTGICSHKH
jgi:hypothetical protein